MTTVQEAASKQVATRDNSPAGLIKQYADDFKTVLPSHVKPDTWVRLAQGALKKGKKERDGRTQLEIAAANNPGVFLAAVLDHIGSSDSLLLEFAGNLRLNPEIVAEARRRLAGEAPGPGDFS